MSSSARQFRTAKKVAHISTFPLMKLPRELRDCIYELALEPRAEFLHTRLEQSDPAYCLPTMPFPRSDDEEHDERSEDDDDNSDDDTHWGQLKAILAFRLSTFHPLLLVSREVNAEVKRLLKILRPRYHSAVKSSIHLRGMKSPHPLFLSICSRSRFVLDSDISHSLFFLLSLPRVIRPFIRNVVITMENLMADDAAVLGVWCRRDDGYCHFTRLLREQLPGLREIALAVPASNMEWYCEWYCEYAPRMVCDMLAKREVDVVRFFYHKSRSEKCMYLEDLEGASEEVAKSACFRCEEVPRRFDTYEEVSWRNIKQHPDWRRMGVNRVVRITRWSDTRLGSPTIKQVVRFEPLGPL
ncbi:hypothetical protein BU26DRAFT_157430 [Trematosphaeria pertusa]|uniref:F-box domain-containing protein n=1 Tax=Trematosphaeria pertusa TaxID=390896 RepID=A0A6A6HWY6_9PLEO|nr:uncharacterized protein BU26DRAFT_157430 [Trematosphaeria pertusa]KAF2242242.1 hypothetical protein BU26DRAFT_157430 [Trematosphaeria pertusa]